MNKDNKSRIIAAARQVISREGVDNATIQAIVDEAGSSKGAIYHYYRSKNEILYDVMDQSLRETTRVAVKMRSGNASPVEVQSDILKGLCKRHNKKDENRLQFYLAHEAMLGNEELKSRFHEKYSEWIGLIEEMLVGIYDLPQTRLNRVLASFLIASIDGLVMQDLLDIRIVEPEDMLELWWLMLRKNIPAILLEILQEEIDGCNGEVGDFKEYCDKLLKSTYASEEE